MESIETKIAPQVEVLLDLLVENEDNPRTCTEENFGKLRKSLERDGDFLQLEDILVYEKEGKYHVIGGNHRVRVLREKKTKKVSVTVFNDVLDGEGNLDERKFWGSLLIDNAHFGSYDMEKLFSFFPKDFLRELDFPEVNKIIAEVEDIKVEKHGDGQAQDEFTTIGNDTQLIKLYFTPQEKAEIDAYFNQFSEPEQSMSEFIFNTLQLCKKSKG